MDTDLVLSPCWEETGDCTDDLMQSFQFVTDISSNHFTSDDIEDELGDFEFNGDLFDFYGELDPVEAAEARALVTELQAGSDILNSLCDESTIKAQHQVYDMFQASKQHKMVQNNRRRKRPISACDGGDGSAVEVTAMPVAGSPSMKKTCDERAVSAVASKAVTPKRPQPRGARGGDGPQRTVPWRKRGSPENTRMRAAVWVYRFAPRVRSKAVQQHFRVSVKSLMRYVYDSCQPEFAAYDLYFGPAGQGVSGMSDRAVKKEDGRVSPASIGYVVDFDTPNIPEMARQFLIESARK